MALSVWFVNSLGDANACRILRHGRSIGEIPLNQGKSNATTSTEYPAVLAAIFIGIFIVLMVVFTFLIVYLYKSGRQRFIKGWLMIAVFVIFAYVGGLYVFDFCRSRCINIDWFTLIFAIWNFSVTGLYAVFGKVPRIVNQAYLIVMSSLMAYIFRTLPAFAVWTILGVLVIWDLYAVLAPNGPLRKLVKIARERNDELPALVYDTNPTDAGRQINATSGRASVMRRGPNNYTTSTTAPPVPTPPVNASSVPLRVEGPGAPNPALTPVPTAHMENARSANPDHPSASIPQKRCTIPAESELKTAHEKPANAGANLLSTPAATGTATGTEEGSSTDGNPLAPINQVPVMRQSVFADNWQKVRSLFRRGSDSNDAAADAGTGAVAAETNANGETQVGTLGTHLKLGLGDFVFYSILVAQASEFGAMTAIASFVAILAGLCSTLFLVTVCRKALPALPLSITAGLISFFLTRFTVLPFVNNLLPELCFY